jgi:hypothetical protein
VCDPETTSSIRHRTSRSTSGFSRSRGVTSAEGARLGARAMTRSRDRSVLSPDHTPGVLSFPLSCPELQFGEVVLAPPPGRQHRSATPPPNGCGVPSLADS